MSKFAIVKNPLQPLKDSEFFDIADITVRQFVLLHKIDMAGKVVLLDSQRVPEEDWDEHLPENGVVVVTPEIGFSAALLLIIAVLVAVAVYFFLDIPVSNLAEEQEADPVYTLRGQKNKMRLSEPVERHYGKTRHWPSYMARPYNQFYNDDQYLYALLCVGLGYYDIHAIQIEDTDISTFEDVTYTVYQPGEKVTLFPTNVQTSTEVSGIELYGENEEDYEDWTGPFVAATAGSKAYTIELDFSCRQGLYRVDTKGKVKNATLGAEAEYRLIDDAGVALGAWTPLESFSKSNDTNKPLRFTMTKNVTPGRYEVRARRTDDKNENIRVRNTLHWEGLRTFCETNQNFGNVTILAIKARATDNLNDSSKNGFNVISTSRLPVYDRDTASWTTTATRNPVWAALDVLRAKYGRRLLTKLIDMDAFCDLAADLEAEGILFDATFEQKSTVWEALSTILSVARAVPCAPAGLITVVRDVPQSVPTLGFNGNNIGKNSVTINTKLFKFSDTDGIEVEYIDEATWKRRTVNCLIGNDRATNPRRIKLIGCTNRDRAYRWGMYQRAVELYLTDNIVFETGLEGGTATYGDLIAVKHELLPSTEEFLPDQTGRLLFGAFSEGLSAFDGEPVTLITLPHPPVFDYSEVHRISLRDKFGVVRGPYLCHPELDPYQVALEVVLDITDIEVAETEEQPLYWFGVSGREYTLCKVVKLEATEPGKVRVTALPYDERIYSFDALTAPPIDYNYNTPIDPTAPIVTGLVVAAYPGSVTEYVATWAPSLGAVSYTVYKSLDGITYQFVDRVTISSCILAVEPGPLWIRVHAVNLGAGPGTTWSGTVGSATAAPDGIEDLALLEEFEGLTLYVTWTKNDLATLYRVQFFIGTTLIAEKTTTASTTSLTQASASNGAGLASIPLSRSLTVKVRGENSIGNGPYSTALAVTNPTSAAPTALTVGTPDGWIYPVTWQHGYEDDLKCCRLYQSSVNGFVPGPSNFITEIPAPESSGELTVVTAGYWRVSTVDKWGVEESMSAQATIP